MTGEGEGKREGEERREGGGKKGRGGEKGEGVVRVLVNRRLNGEDWLWSSETIVC